MIVHAQLLFRQTFKRQLLATPHKNAGASRAHLFHANYKKIVGDQFSVKFFNVKM